MKLELKEIQEIIPHRYPMLLVDRIIEGEPGKYAVGLKNVTANEPYFQGHFPDEPIMPGVLQLEALAQVAACCCLSLPEYQGRIALYAGVNKARFKGIVRPGDQVIMRIDVTRSRSGFVFCTAEARVDDEVVCSADLSFALMEDQNG